MVTQEELEKMSPEQIAELQRQNCIFCKIVSGEIPAKKVYEDDLILGFMDINPGRKGHVLLIPKEHIPIFPLMPPDTFKRLFERASLITKALKSVTLSPAASMFAANGAVAGQQIPHAVLHLFPREQGDALNTLTIPQDQSKQQENDQLKDALAQNMAIMLKGYREREGRNQQEQAQSTQESVATSQNEQSQQQMSVEEAQEARREHIALLLEQNQEVRAALKNNTEEFKAMIGSNPQLQALFEGVDIDGLAQKLKLIDEQFAQEEQQEQEPQPVTQEQTTEQPIEQKEELPAFEEHAPVQEETGHAPEPAEQVQLNEEEQQNEESVTSASQSESATEEILSEDATKKDSALSEAEQEIFLGENPQEQREQLFSYFQTKPQAKALFVENLTQFKELLEGRPDVQPLFAHINLEKLQEYLQSGHPVPEHEQDDSGDVNRAKDDTTEPGQEQPEKKASLESMIGGGKR